MKSLLLFIVGVSVLMINVSADKKAGKGPKVTQIVSKYINFII